MNLQIIKSVNGKDEYVLLPIDIYQTLKRQIDKIADSEYESFDVNDYVTNPAALLRINANLTQKELSEKMNVSQAYISKIEAQDTVSATVLSKIKKSLK